MRKKTTNLNQKSLSKSNTSRPSKKSSSTNKDNLQLKSKPKSTNIFNNNKKKWQNTKSKSKSKTNTKANTKANNQQYFCVMKANNNKISQSFVLGTKKDSEELSEARRNLRYQFQKATVKVFHVLDIFSRGSISEANINRWVPEAALYFLGSVFQKIRVFRIVMDESQFKEQCYKIFLKSSDEDVKQFIQNIQKHDNFNEQKISFQGQQKQTIQSQVEDRFCFNFQSGQASFRKIALGQKTMPLQTIKSNQMYYDEDEQKQQKKQIVNNNQKKNKEKMDKSKISPLNNLNQFQNVAVRNRRLLDVENMPLKINDKQKPSKLKNNTNGCQSPFFKGSVTSVLAKFGSKKKQSADRIDKLSMKLQDYIKQNAERLQRSKNCRIQL